MGIELGLIMAKKLTAKQKLFIAEYLIDLNATRAAIAAGYSEDTARSIGAENLTKPDISAAIQAKLEKRCAKLEISADYVLSGIKDTIERCRQTVPVVDRKGKAITVEDGDGDTVPAYTFQALPALKGFELLGKHLKLFTEKIEIEDKRPILLAHSVPRQAHDKQETVQ